MPGCATGLPSPQANPASPGPVPVPASHRAPAPSGQRDPGNAESDSSAQRKAFEAKLQMGSCGVYSAFLPAVQRRCTFQPIHRRCEVEATNRLFRNRYQQTGFPATSSQVSLVDFWGDHHEWFYEFHRPAGDFHRRHHFVIKAIRGKAAAACAGGGAAGPPLRPMLVFGGCASPSRSLTACPPSTICAKCRSTFLPEVCITKDNTQLQVDGIPAFQVTDPEARHLWLVQLIRRHHAARANHACAAWSASWS